MTWDAIGAIGEIVGAIAVVASLIYLASQIRNQNNIALRDSRSAISQRWNEIAIAKVENDDVAALLNKLKSYSPTLTEDECVKAHGLAQMHLNVCAAINSALEAGIMSDDILKRNLYILAANTGEYPGLYPFIEDIMNKVGIAKGLTPAFDRLIEDIEKTKSANDK